MTAGRMTEKIKTGMLLRTYCLVTRISLPLARVMFSRRLKRGKEDPDRFEERFGIPTQPRPEGDLIGMHACGVGELLTAPGLIRSLLRLQPKLNFLLTSTARTSVDAILANVPPRTCHQYVPVDCQRYVRRFLEYWRPDLSVWIEREIWPMMIQETFKRKIPLALVNGRMDRTSAGAKRKAKGLYRDLYRRFKLICVQDSTNADRFLSLGARSDRLWVSGSIKAGASPLADQPEARVRLKNALSFRRVWLAASTHAPDEKIAADAHLQILVDYPDTLLVVVPRYPHRARQVISYFRERSLNCSLVRKNMVPSKNTQVIVVDRIGQLGLWYRIAPVSLIGGSFGNNGGGHNPYEPLRLGCAVIHGPCVRNFESDYAILHEFGAVQLATDATDLACAIRDSDVVGTVRQANQVLKNGDAKVTQVAQRLLDLLECGVKSQGISR